jgi:hypothetical protein
MGLPNLLNLHKGLEERKQKEQFEKINAVANLLFTKMIEQKLSLPEVEMVVAALTNQTNIKIEEFLNKKTLEDL